MHPWTFRLAAALAALMLLGGIVQWFQQARTRYWLNRDRVRGVASITDKGSRNTAYYTYSVAGAHYEGHSPREWRDARYRTVGVGATAPVWYSRSRPWLSSLAEPDPTLYSLPWVVVALAVESVLLACMIVPWRTPAPRSERPNRAE